eukprot:1695933-Rhodomonas_salina.4
MARKGGGAGSTYDSAKRAGLQRPGHIRHLREAAASATGAATQHNQELCLRLCLHMRVSRQQQHLSQKRRGYAYHHGVFAEEDEGELDQLRRQSRVIRNPGKKNGAQSTQSSQAKPSQVESSVCVCVCASRCAVDDGAAALASDKACSPGFRCSRASEGARTIQFKSRRSTGLTIS